MSPRILAACGGFLLAVLWMDLMFDVQVRRMRDDTERAVASIAAYYRRVTTDAYPMNRLIAGVMLLTLTGAVAQLLVGPGPRGKAFVALSLATGGIGLALVRVVANAARLGSRSDPPARQAELAVSIYRDHVRCFVLMAAFVAVELSM